MRCRLWRKNSMHTNSIWHAMARLSKKRNNLKFQPYGDVKNLDLKMAGLLLLWLVTEEVCKVKYGDHVDVFSDNHPTVSWVDRLAPKISVVTRKLLRALSLKLKMKGASPLTPFQIYGKQNAMTDIPSRLFGSAPKWNCKTDNDLLFLFNKDFPPPNKASWTVFHPSKEISTKRLSVLRMEVTTMEEWDRLGKIRNRTGEIFAPLLHLWEWILRYRIPNLETRSAACQYLEACR